MPAKAGIIRNKENAKTDHRLLKTVMAGPDPAIHAYIPPRP
jgi:hypothetical protein